MNYCHVSAQINRHQAIIDQEAELQEVVEKRSIEIFDDMLEGDSEIDEDVSTWADENGIIFDILKVAYNEKVSREERKENLMKLLEGYSTVIDEMAQEQALKELK